MLVDKSLISGSTAMLILKLIDKQDMYGYQMIEELAKQSDDTFHLKAGTLYPLLHSLVQKGWVTSYDKTADNTKIRKYYHITKQGQRVLLEKEQEWSVYVDAVNNVLKGGLCLEFKG